ncbi:2-succinyl-6-hydroxy-2,4-cyclohexadiene-1-carboxylate synthase [Myxococcota bacterium]|nr:2-succinyl-6-hydroxy-2,4-cyclohexadiene-1-carboxylate synthase [Myxococcota bacterium]
MSSETHRVDVGELTLHVEIDGHGSPLLMLHGFTGSGRSLTELAADLMNDHRVIRVDLVGHGHSDAPRELAPYRMERCVSHLLELLDQLDLERAHLLGYSMGGRTALQLAARAPHRVTSGLLIGASAGFRTAAERTERIRRDEALAHRIEHDGLEAFVDHWMALPLFASQASLGAAALARQRAQRLENSPHGLANSLRGMGAGAQAPLHDALECIDTPLLLLAGSLDEKFLAIASDLAPKLPRGHTACIEGAGHAVHLERPAEVSSLARKFFAEADRAPTTPRGRTGGMTWHP